jgi:antitoxin MazE
MQKLTRWGHSTGIRIPMHILKSMKLGVGDFVNVRLMDSGDIRVRSAKARQQADQLPAENRALHASTEPDKW